MIGQHEKIDELDIQKNVLLIRFTHSLGEIHEDCEITKLTAVQGRDPVLRVEGRGKRDKTPLNWPDELFITFSVCLDRPSERETMPFWIVHLQPRGSLGSKKREKRYSS
ncbi:unnamed protein product [Protopolystoma xenopodis]|uniref:Uncharacterized protein n=1 Tax=Protopolystoma xenopodis TaxID=117903 RepID=A0A448XPG6_9PLAT|nr:unnamed protein product [Protopolystoma xenopodis]